MDFSVIIPSRNRSQLLRTAIESVLSQDHPEVEILLINDGSEGDEAAAYAQIARDYAPKLRMFDLEATRSGHGQSYGINRGAELARGRYLTFLDDDDFWTDAHHLSRCQQLIEAAPRPVQLLYCDQRAIRNGQRVQGPVWLDGIESNPAIAGERIAGSEGCFYSVAQLIEHAKFGHLNVSLIERDLFARIGGMDNNIRYECDRDFYLRCIDEAGEAVHIPVEVSQHNVPDQNRTDNMSTIVSALQKSIYQLYVFDKAILFSKSDPVRQHGGKYKGYALKEITEHLVGAGRYRDARRYAWQALGAGFSAKWLAYTLWLSARALLSTPQQRTSA